jgi:hypothetical protein
MPLAAYASHTPNVKCLGCRFACNLGIYDTSDIYRHRGLAELLKEAEQQSKYIPNVPFEIRERM